MMKLSHCAFLVLSALAPAAALAQAMPTTEQDIPEKCVLPERPKSTIRPEHAETVVELLIDAAGRVQNGRVVGSSGATIFDQAALAALRRCDYAPVKRQGQPVAGRIRVKYAWTLE